MQPVVSPLVRHGYPGQSKSGGQLQIRLDMRPEWTDPTSGKTYEAQNEVKGFKSTSGSIPKAAPAAKAAEPAQAAPAAASGKSAPPWAKK